MDEAERYRQDQDFMFSELEARSSEHDRAYLRDLFIRAEAAGLAVPALKLKLALGATTSDEIERDIETARR